MKISFGLLVSENNEHLLGYFVKFAFWLENIICLTVYTSPAQKVASCFSKHKVENTSFQSYTNAGGKTKWYRIILTRLAGDKRVWKSISNV